MYVRGRDEYLGRLEAERAERDQQIQERLQHQAETLREVDRRKSDFVATLGHEMRNPLAPLSHVVRLLELRRGRRTPAWRPILDISSTANPAVGTAGR